MGWLVGLALIGTIVLLVAGPANDDGEPAIRVDVLKLALGALLLVVALRQWRGRPHADDRRPRRVMPPCRGAQAA